MLKLGKDISIAIIAALCAACTATGDLLAPPGPIEIQTSAPQLFDRDLDVSISNLVPNNPATLTVRAVDGRGQVWTSSNTYIVSEAGSLDLERDAPVEGTYSGAHPMGPFWSMTGADRFATTRGDSLVTLSVTESGKGKAEQSFTWLSPIGNPEIAIEQVRTDELSANFYRPQYANEPLPGVILVGGSGGGFNTERAALLASHGYAVLDVAYFDAPGRPEYFLESQPLEYFQGAIDWLIAQPDIRGDAIGIMGKSYGAQLALVLASYEPRIKTVVVEAASSFVTGTSDTLPDGPYQSAWSIDGEELYYLKGGDPDQPVQNPKQINIQSGGAEAIAKEGQALKAAIKVERINGPILLISGKDDRLWEATQMAEQVLARLDDNDFRFPAKHIAFEDAGHNLGGGQQAYGVPNLPPKARPGRGGTVQGKSVAGIEAWREALAFLEQHLQ